MNSPAVAPRRGAPTRADAHSRIRLEIHVTEHERQALRRMAAENGRPMTTLIREAVNEFVADYGERTVFLTLTNRRT